MGRLDSTVVVTVIGTAAERSRLEPCESTGPAQSWTRLLVTKEATAGVPS
jgi:hypothetical protein